MAHKKWKIADADKEKASVLSEKLNIDPFIAFLLVSRGISDELSASDFLFSDNAFSSPYSFKDMDKAVERINLALERDEKICIFGDYDCDGVTATALLYTFLESLGAQVIYFIPNRLTDGYGMNNEAIEYIREQGTDLIITVDNGISAIDEAEYIYQLGMELVVTDHHQLGEKLPRACAVVNPHRDDNDLSFRDFAGVGVAFKLACALYDGDVDEMLEQYADLVTIGTIGDIVSLRSENRRIVKYGLNLINADTRIGLVALRKAAGNYENELTSTDVAFQICPRINAAGRMDSANIALELLVTDDYDDACFKADQLNTENAHRHQVENNISNEIIEKISDDSSFTKDRILVIAGENYHQGVVGIVAARLVSLYSKPAIVISVDDNGECVASARSIEGFNIFDAISSCEDILTHFGGHPLAAGLGIREENIDEFRRRINEYAYKNYPIMPAQVLNLDCKLSPFYLSLELVDNLNMLEPYGAENPQAVFGLFGVTISAITPMGEGKHIRLECTKKGKAFRAVMFNQTADELAYTVGDKVDLAVKISKNQFKGKYYLSIKIVDIRRNKIDDDKYFLEKSDYELFKLGQNNKTELLPSREDFSVLYRFLKQNNGYKHSFDDLYFALNQELSFGKLSYALDAFEEVGIISRNGGITVNNINGKADLQNTKTIKSLKGRLFNE